MSIPTQPLLWLDELPLGARSKIAWYVSCGTQNQNMLNLGMVNRYQKEAVVEALSFTYHTDQASLYVGEMWAYIFKHAIRKLVATQPPEISGISVGGHYHHLRALFFAPTLRELHFRADDRFIGDFVAPRRLRKAVVKYKYESPVWPVAEIACSINTEDLTIVCDPHEGCSLLRLRLVVSPEVYNRFKAIRIHCKCSRSGLWALLRRLPNVTEISFASKPAPEMYPRINQVENVRLIRNRSTWELVPNFSQSIIEIGKSVLSDVEEVARLEQCINLNSFHCAIKPGADMGFKRITKTLYSLRVLKLSWAGPSACFNCNACGRKSLGETHYAAPGALLNLIKHAPKLTELELTQVLLELDELVEILKHIGARLTKFSSTIKFEGKLGCHYLDTVMKALRKYNPRVPTSNSRATIFTKGTPFVSMAM